MIYDVTPAYFPQLEPIPLNPRLTGTVEKAHKNAIFIAQAASPRLLTKETSSDSQNGPKAESNIGRVGNTCYGCDHVKGPESARRLGAYREHGFVWSTVRRSLGSS